MSQKTGFTILGVEVAVWESEDKSRWNGKAKTSPDGISAELVVFEALLKAFNRRLVAQELTNKRHQC